MKQLHQKIESRKKAIHQKKQHLSDDVEAAKRRLTSSKGLSLTTLGGMAIGFLLLPKKFKIIKSVLKAYTMAATLRGIFDLIPHPEEKKRKRKS